MLKEKGDENISKYLLGQKDLAKKIASRQNEVVRNIVGVYKNKYLYVEGRKIPIYFKKKKSTPHNGAKLKIHNALLGYYKKLQLVVYAKKDFRVLEK